MKRIFFVTVVVALSLVSCVGGEAPPVEIQEKQLNISILLDLSERISPEKYPNQWGYDIGNIKTITEFFKSNMESLGAWKAKGKIRIFLIPPPDNTNINSIVKKLTIDCSKMNNNEKKEVYDDITKRYIQNLEEIYQQTIVANRWQGSDIWRFFKDNVKDYCIDKDSNYRNILIILTNGYLYEQHTKDPKRPNTTSIRAEYLGNYRRDNWKQLIERDSLSIKAERNDLQDLEILVLGIKAEETRNRIDEDILIYLWENWFDRMNVSHYKIYRSDLPANTKTRIENFLK